MPSRMLDWRVLRRHLEDMRMDYYVHDIEEIADRCGDVQRDTLRWTLASGSRPSWRRAGMVTALHWRTEATIHWPGTER
jgi:hypothetical protein